MHQSAPLKEFPWKYKDVSRIGKWRSAERMAKRPIGLQRCFDVLPTDRNGIRQLAKGQRLGTAPFAIAYFVGVSAPGVAGGSGAGGGGGGVGFAFSTLTAFMPLGPRSSSKLTLSPSPISSSIPLMWTK